MFRAKNLGRSDAFSKKIAIPQGIATAYRCCCGDVKGIKPHKYAALRHSQKAIEYSSGLNITATRAYSPALGRFLNRDPIGEAPLETNLYAYVGNNPISRIDPEGTGSIDLGGDGSINGPLGPSVPNPIGAMCWNQCKSKLPIIGPLLVTGGLPLIGVGGKIGGATPGTSPLSAGLRGLIGDWGPGGPYRGRLGETHSLPHPV